MSREGETESASEHREDLRRRRDVIDVQTCVRCAYPLAGLPFEGVCPECGLAVRWSLKDDLFCFAPREELERLCLGCQLVSAGLAILMLGMLIGGLFGIIAVLGVGVAGLGSPTMRTIQMGAFAAVGLFYLGGCVVGLQGWVRLTAHGSGQTIESDARGRDWQARWSAVAASFTGLCGLATGFVLLFVRSIDSAIVGGVVFVLLCAWVVAVGLAMQHLAVIARRLPSGRLAARATLLTGVGPLLMTVGLLACGIGPLVAAVLAFALMEGLRLRLEELIRKRDPV